MRQDLDIDFNNEHETTGSLTLLRTGCILLLLIY